MTGAQFLKRKDRHSFAVPEDGSFDAALAPFLAELNVIKKSAETNVAKAEEKQRRIAAVTEQQIARWDWLNISDLKAAATAHKVTLTGCKRKRAMIQRLVAADVAPPEEPPSESSSSSDDDEPPSKRRKGGGKTYTKSQFQAAVEREVSKRIRMEAADTDHEIHNRHHNRRGVHHEDSDFVQQFSTFAKAATPLIEALSPLLAIKSSPSVHVVPIPYCPAAGQFSTPSALVSAPGQPFSPSQPLQFFLNSPNPTSGNPSPC